MQQINKVLIGNKVIAVDWLLGENFTRYAIARQLCLDGYITTKHLHALDALTMTYESIDNKNDYRVSRCRNSIIVRNDTIIVSGRNTSYKDCEFYHHTVNETNVSMRRTYIDHINNGSTKQ